MDLRHAITGVCTLLVLAAMPAAQAETAVRPCNGKLSIVINRARGTTPLLQYTARELEQYATQLFEKPIRVFVTDKDEPTIQTDPMSGGGAKIKLFSYDAGLGLDADDSYEIRPTTEGVEIHGSNERSTLYGAYELIRFWGVQFYLSGDVLPPQGECRLPTQVIRAKATMKMRGVHPYPDFLSGPTGWDEPQFEKYIRQLPKLGLNFFGIHQYTYEPYLDYEVEGVHPRNGKLETSEMDLWGYAGVRTCDFEVGRELFGGACVWGSKAALEPKTPAERYARAEALMAFALNKAHELGLVTAFGFEPMSNDPEFAELAKTTDGANRVLHARIDGVLRAFPNVDYVWLFADETNQANRAVLEQTYALLGEGQRYLSAAAPEKRLMLGGWNTENSLKEYDKGYKGVEFEPETVFTSYGNYDPWRTVREKRHASLEKLTHPHAIATWCEYDGRLLTGIQPNVTAYTEMHPAILDSKALGFFFLHWNTRACDSNLDYLRRVGWQTKKIDPEKFYTDYLSTRFGLNGLRDKGAFVSRLAKSQMILEDLNKTLSFADQPFWLLGDDWTVLGPWKFVADAVENLRRGKALSKYERDRFDAQSKTAKVLRAKFAEPLLEAKRAFSALAANVSIDGSTAAYLANRIEFQRQYLIHYLALSEALSYVVYADRVVRDGGDPSGLLTQFAGSLDIEGWKSMIELYTRFIDDRGEIGIVISLNQKLLAGLRKLEAVLPH